jgi:hypothetical protein
MIMLSERPKDGIAHEAIREIASIIISSKADGPVDGTKGFTHTFELLGEDVVATFQRKGPGEFSLYNVDIKMDSGTIRFGSSAFAAAAFLFGQTLGRVQGARQVSK